MIDKYCRCCLVPGSRHKRSTTCRPMSRRLEDLFAQFGDDRNEHQTDGLIKEFFELDSIHESVDE